MRRKTEIVGRFFQPGQGSFFLFGPRGTGKSTLARSLFPQALRIDLLDPEWHRSLAARPERLRDIVGGSPKADWVVIDEIQKVPELLTVVHSLMEERCPAKFVLTGSSSRKIKRAGVDLLAGRAILRHLHPFLAGELGGQFDLDSALTLGMIPLVRFSPDPIEALRTYVALYIREEVQQEGLVRRFGAFSRFLEAVSFSHGQVLNIANLARECEAERKTVAGFLEILEDLLLAFRIPVFAKRARRELASHAKFYLVDPGIFQSLRPKGPLDEGGDLLGQALEGLVAQHFRAWISLGHEEWSLFYWRTRSNVEVDFIVYGPGGIFAFEVKNSRQTHDRDLKGLLAFGEDYPTAQLVLLNQSGKPARMGKVWVLPVSSFLRKLDPIAELGSLISGSREP